MIKYIFKVTILASLFVRCGGQNEQIGNLGPTGTERLTKLEKQVKLLEERIRDSQAFLSYNIAEEQLKQLEAKLATLGPDDSVQSQLAVLRECAAVLFKPNRGKKNCADKPQKPGGEESCTEKPNKPEAEESYDERLSKSESGITKIKGNIRKLKTDVYKHINAVRGSVHKLAGQILEYRRIFKAFEPKNRANTLSNNNS